MGPSLQVTTKRPGQKTRQQLNKTTAEAGDAKKDGLLMQK
jgi:hypothetical protein